MSYAKLAPRLDIDRYQCHSEVAMSRVQLALNVDDIDEADTTCCYARQDKFWVTGAPGGERWEIYTVLEDSETFWGQDGAQRWEAVQAGLDATAAGQAVQCCGGPQP